MSNLTRLATPSISGGNAPLPGRGESAKADAERKFRPVTEHTQVKRTLPQTASSIAEPTEVAEPAEAAEPSAAAEPDANQRWKKAQAERKAQREAAQDQKVAKQQLLAKDLLSKGDLPAAAKALGMSVSELVTLTNHAAMGIKAEEEVKPPTPEEQRELDVKTLKESVAKLQKERDDLERDRNVRTYVEAHIAPVLADKDAFEMIHAAGVDGIKAYAYDYMNRHFQETGETLVAKDVLESIEENLYRAHVETLEKAKGIKKVAKYFAPSAEDSAATAASEEPAVEARPGTLTDSRRRSIAEAMAAELAESRPVALGEQRETSPPKPLAEEPAGISANPTGVNLKPRWGGRLTAKQKLERAQAEEDAEAASNAARLLAARKR